MLRLGHTKAQSMITYQSTKAALRSLTFKLTNGDCSSTGRWLTGDFQVTASEWRQCQCPNSINDQLKTSSTRKPITISNSGIQVQQSTPIVKSSIDKPKHRIWHWSTKSWIRQPENVLPTVVVLWQLTSWCTICTQSSEDLMWRCVSVY